uniref:Extracellular matrix protein FRAS1-like n=1 Tax=Sinocyclocheilus grahami TaxID=75366 RepID=A0A672MQB1_SINGR
MFNNTSWKPDTCQDCICYNDIVICKPTRCQNPQCDFQRGQRLRIPPNKCCPECFAQLPGVCQHEGMVYGHDSQWSNSKCSVCTCSHGKVTCGPRACPSLSCGKDQSPFIPDGDCCPVCAHNGASCSWEGRQYRDGVEWTTSPCAKCRCRNGHTECLVAECQPVTCKAVSNSPELCLHGKQWQRGSCTTCVCDRAHSRCQMEKCPPLHCDKGQMKIKRPGQCCEDCVSSKGSCLYEGIVHYHGDMWNGTGCEFCMCERGQVLCQRVECARMECPQGEKLVHLPGKCCPECRTTTSSCTYSQPHQKVQKSIREGLCHECQCQEGHVTCYQHSCPTCPLGTLTIPHPEQCCPDCNPVQCHEDCLTCSGTPDHCDSCQDPSALLMNGRCLQSCPEGFFAQGKFCAACQPSCATCENDFECTACGGFFLLSGRQCVTTCERGLFQDHTHCCHDSCSSCQGAGPQDCLTCSDPSHLLKDGFCVLDCGPGFYANQGSCYACDASCATCQPVNPTCMSCPPEHALHQGKCVPQCPPQYYKDDHGHCQACHSSCASCSGPAVSHCTSCSKSLILNQGQCVESCGEGLFSRGGHCHRCHASCRVCVGPDSSDCMQCVKQEEVMQPQNGHVSHGSCMSACRPQHYLDADQTCRECHISCSGCSGGSFQNCTSCKRPSVLHQGQCLDKCPHGFHVQDRTCQACHSSCKECTGPSQAECSACPAHASLHNGYCRTSCPEGQYLNAVGYCIECEEGCQRCVADLHSGFGTVCLWCKFPRMLLLGDHCVPQCPPKYYRWHRACKKCHSSCEECSGDGPHSCTSCLAPEVLAPSGLCSPRCPNGYYADENRVCQMCDAQCLSCEMAGVCTSCSDPAKVLLFGECQYESCAHQYYLNTTTRTCRECDWSCNACRGPLRSDCLQCMEGYVLQDGICVPGCSPGFYQNAERCLSCDEHCEQCQVHGQCQLCQLPYAMLNGQCVLECGKRYFLDASTRQCTACSAGCLECVSAGECRVCAENSFLKGGQCIVDCGHGYYYLNITSTFVTANSRAPSLYINGSLLVPIGGVKPLDPALLSIKDADSQSESMLLQLLQPPSNGHLVVLENDRERALGRDDTFTLTQLKRRAVRFIHDKEVTELIQGYFPRKFILYSEPPTVITNQILYINSGETAVISRSILHISDLDNPQDVFITVLDPPQHGHLTHVHGDVQVTHFKLEDLDREQLQYVHDGSEGDQDRLLLQVNDGHSYQNILFHIMPRTWVREGGMVRLSKKCLSAHFQGTSDSEILYTIHSEREIVLVSMPADGPVEAWQSFPDAQDTTPTSSFTQQDVNEGTVWYRHYGSGSQRDTFQFQVRRTQLAFGKSPALEDRVTVISPSALSFTDSETPSDKLVYNTTKALTSGHEWTLVPRYRWSMVGTAFLVLPSVLYFLASVHFVYLSKLSFTSGDTFTSSDVTRNVLQYEHAGLTTEEDSMTFSVTDGISMTSITLQVLVSEVKGDAPKRDPKALLSMEVAEKSSTIIRRSQLAYVDDESPDERVFMQLVSVPMYGILTKTKAETNHEELSEYSSFTMEDINNHKIRYVTSFETGNQPVTDIFHFVVYDGENNRLENQMFTITITSIQRQPPVVTVRSGIKVQEGGRVQLSANHIIASDPDTPRKDLLVWLISPPKYGFIENTKQGESPSYLTSDHIFYNQNIRQANIRQDVFSFYISDGSSQTEHTKEDRVPIISVNSIQVEENSGVVITNSSLNVLDQDTPENELLFALIKKPSYGKLRRRQFYSQPLENGRILQQGSTFTYQDVLDELLVYTPEGRGSGTDEIQFSVTDGIYTETGRLEFSMDIRKREGPRVTINRGLQIASGSSSKITEQHLKGMDVDSDNLKLRFTLTKDLSVGSLLLNTGRNKAQISVKGPVTSFTQDDINKGHVEYIHEKGESGGSFSFKFNLEDPEGNRVIDQSFFISVLEDRHPPTVVVNKGLVMDENTLKKITTLQLSSTDQDSEPDELIYRVTKQPQLGHLEHSSKPGTDKLVGSDEPTVELNYSISQTFYISIRPVDDSLPILQVPGMRVQEGVRKTITEFELKATDADTEEDSVTFTIVQAPRHGTIERTSNGQHYRQTNTFTMDDIYQNRISYNHDGSNSLKDRFTFTVGDGTNMFFIIEEGGKEVVTAAPQKFKIDILPVDDGTPRIVTNLGLQWLEYMENKATNLITKKELLTIDPDTDDGQLTYEVTTEAKHGYLESKLNPGKPITSFTQADINLGLIRYVLSEDNVQETMDNFRFFVKDSKPNIVSDNVFHIQWSLISFEHKSYNVSEKDGTVAVTVKRTGNLNQYAIVLCRTEQGTATSTSSMGSRAGQQDYVEYAGQVQFDEREDTKVCTIVINDDQVFENTESFNVELSMPVYALLGSVTRAKVNINDTEDEPTLKFDKKTYHVNESTGFIFAPVERNGDTSSTVSALCYTVPKSARGSSLHALESGSDYKTRGMSSDNRVIFGPGVSMSTCDVKLIDDSEYELSEEFELVLSDASENARMGDVTVAKVIIDGPNDASTVFLGNASFTFSEDAGTIEIPVLRQGSDLSSVTSVWCATRPAEQDSATPSVDYIPSSKKVEFRPGKTEETCSLTIMDDIQNPTIEGKECFIVFLSSPNGAVLTEPYEASVYITDTTQDIPSMQFEKLAYTVKEKDGVLHIPIFRTGDLSYKSSVRCFTRTMSAMVMDDFEERRNADDSRITFRKGEKVKNCTILIQDDSVFEPEEEFQVHLGSPQGDHWIGAMIGVNDIVTVTITNDEDAPTIEFEQASYQVCEPPGPDGIEVLNIKVIRKGDLDRTSKIRCSTRDGSAQSGVDYNPKSRVLKFSPGVDHILFKVEILSNEDREWHESFSLVLGPDDPVEAVLGQITMATVTILDQEAAGSLILPAPPIVVSLSDYDYVQEVTKEGSKKSPSPGYPLVCVTPCDPHYPKYSDMRERCEEAGINQTSVHFSWEVATPTDTSGARSPFETVTDNTPYTTVNHMVLDSIYFSRRFHVRCVAQARDKAGHLGTPLRSNIVTIGTEGSICHTPVTTGTARGFQAQSFIATLKYLDVKHKEHPNRIHISVQIPHQDGMLPLVSTMPLHNLHFLLSESIYRQQHVCSNLVTLKDLHGISETGFLDDVSYDSISLGPGYDRPYQFNPSVREPRSIQLYKHLNLKSCIWTFDAYYDMTELIDVCGGSVTADFQVRDSTQSFLTVQVPLYVSYIYVTAPRGWASLEHHTEMEFSFFYDTVLWRTGIQTDSVLSARLQIIRIFIRDDGRLVIEFKTHAKFRGQFVPDHHTLPGQKSHLMAPDHLGGIEFDLQLMWSAQSFDSPYQLWRATNYSGEYTVFLIPCTVQPTQAWVDSGDKPLSCTAHAPEKFLLPIAFQQTNRPVPVVYSLDTEFQLCNNEKVFLMDPALADMSVAEMDYKGAFSMGQTLYGRVLWNPDQNLNLAYKLQLEKVYLCTGRDGYVPFFDPTGTLYNEGPQYGCIQPNKHLKHRFLLLDRKQPDVCNRYFHDVPFEANFASDIPDLQSLSAMPGVDGFTMKVDALYKVEAGHQWYLQVIYVIGPESISAPRIQRSVTYELKRSRRDLVDRSGHLMLDESLIYDNEGDQVKNGTNMKTLKLEVEPSGTFNPQMGGSIGGGMAAIVLLLLVLLAFCFMVRKCRRVVKKRPTKAAEDYPLNTKVEVCIERLEKNLNSKYCSVKNVNVLNKNPETYKINGVKVKQVNLEVKLHNNLNDGTEV